MLILLPENNYCCVSEIEIEDSYTWAKIILSPEIEYGKLWLVKHKLNKLYFRTVARSVYPDPHQL